MNGARDAASASESAYLTLEKTYDEERAARRRTKRLAQPSGLLSLTLFTLLAVGILVVWRL